MSNVGKSLREFSVAGPCLTLGTVSDETAKQWKVWSRNDGIKRFGKNEFRHVDPCSSCRDHPTTQYPNGYDN